MKPYGVLSGYLDTVHDEPRGLQLADMVIEGLNAWPEEKLTGRLALELIGVIDNAAKRRLNLKRYAEAEAAYTRALQMMERAAAADPAMRKLSAGILHNLGAVAQAQRRWAEAEGYYQQALAIFVAFSARYEQAATYHNLGMVAQAQRRWAEAEQYYRNGLEILTEFEDWHSVSITIGSIARLWRESGAVTIPAMVADVLGVPRAEAEQLLKKALDGGRHRTPRWPADQAHPRPSTWPLASGAGSKHKTDAIARLKRARQSAPTCASGTPFP